MPNFVDRKIAEITDIHTSECERLNVSRNVLETKRRIEAALPEFSKVDVAASGYWEGLSDANKMQALRSAIVELSGKLTPPAPVKADIPTEAEVEPKRRRKVVA
jgi:hypothetical protein